MGVEVYCFGVVESKKSFDAKLKIKKIEKFCLPGPCQNFRFLKLEAAYFFTHPVYIYYLGDPALAGLHDFKFKNCKR